MKSTWWFKNNKSTWILFPFPGNMLQTRETCIMSQTSLCQAWKELMGIKTTEHLCSTKSWAAVSSPASSMEYFKGAAQTYLQLQDSFSMQKRSITQTGTLPWRLELVPGWFSRIYFLRAVVEQVFGSFMAAIADRMASSIRVPPSRGFSPDFFSYFPRRKRKASRQHSPKPGQDKLLCTRWVGAPASAQICFTLNTAQGMLLSQL